MNGFRLLIVEDEPDLRQLYALALAKIGHTIDEAANLAVAHDLLARQGYHVILTDMRLPDGSGLDLLRALTQQGRPERVIVITAHGSTENAVQALKAGAFDYLTKPVAPARLRQAVLAGLQAQAAPEADRTARAVNAAAEVLGRLIGHSPAMQAIRAQIEQVARTMAPVLIHGESGTGKELIARALHACSHRAAGPLIAVNCGAIPAELIESELFGYKRGAFTGAAQDRQGLFHAANGGTLFLDEVADLPLPMQVKLLRALQERAIRPIGATAEDPIDVRIISATHKNLEQLIQEGRFRHDLYYRLNVIPIYAPALREHLQDLPSITSSILKKLAARDGLTFTPQLTPSALQKLSQYSFPGNVRELENILERAIALHPSPWIDADAIHIMAPPPAANIFKQTYGNATVAADTNDAPMTRAQLYHLLEHHRWNQSRTARELGWTLSKLRYWIQKLDIK